MYPVIKILDRELYRQDNTIELIASENFVSELVMKLVEVYSQINMLKGIQGKRYYNGCLHMDEIEDTLQSVFLKVYMVLHLQMFTHCGANANTSVYHAFLEPHDRILGMDLASGGHLSHGAKVNISGKVYESYSYGVDSDGWLDYEAIAKIAEKIRPKMIVAGASSYPRRINWGIIKDIADHYGAKLLTDIAHYSGLIAGGVYPNPIEYADVVTSTTHKTLGIREDLFFE